jgi:hypothetical protein
VCSGTEELHFKDIQTEENWNDFGHQIVNDMALYRKMAGIFIFIWGMFI